MSSLIQPPREVFTDTDGTPLESGYIYIGDAGLNPETNEIQAYTDAALSLKIAQPIRTLGGHPVASGTPVDLYVSATSYSITTRNKNKTLILTDLTEVSVVSELRDDLAHTTDLTKGNRLVYYPRTANEIAGGVTPVNYYLMPFDLLRYVTNTTPGTTDLSTGFLNCAKSMPLGGPIYMPEGKIKISDTIQDDVLDVSSNGQPITLIGKGASEVTGEGTEILTTGAMVGIKFDGNRSGGRDFTIRGDGGAADTTSNGVQVQGSRAQWENVLSIAHRGDGFKFIYGNASSFENILCLSNGQHGFNADGTGHTIKTGASAPNDLNACTLINIDSRANTGIGFRTGVNSGFANNCHQITVQGNGGVGMEFNGNFWNVFGFYGEANDSAGTNRDVSFSATAQGNFVYGYFSNVGGTHEDLSVNQRNYIEQVKGITAEFHTEDVRLGESANPAGYIKFSGEGDATNRTITLEGTSGSQTLIVKSSGVGTLKLDPQDGITREAPTAPTLLNSWVNFGGSRKVAGFYIDAFNIVHLEGVIKSGTATPATQLFMLPAGYRPVGGRVYFVTTSNAAYGSGFIDTTGEVYIDIGSNVYFSLDSVSFRAS